VPWVIRDVVNDLNKAVARRWHSVDPLLPEPNDLPEGCTAPFLASGGNGRPAGLGSAAISTSRPTRWPRPGAPRPSSC